MNARSQQFGSRRCRNKVKIVSPVILRLAKRSPRQKGPPCRGVRRAIRNAAAGCEVLFAHRESCARSTDGEGRNTGRFLIGFVVLTWARVCLFRHVFYMLPAKQLHRRNECFGFNDAGARCCSRFFWPLEAKGPAGRLSCRATCRSMERGGPVRRLWICPRHPSGCANHQPMRRQSIPPVSQVSRGRQPIVSVVSVRRQRGQSQPVARPLDQSRRCRVAASATIALWS
jgi:hypothetical protein